MGNSNRLLRAGVALAALTVMSGTAAAQSTLPPPDVANGQADTANQTNGVENIVITGSRIRRDPLNQDSPVVLRRSEGRFRRPAFRPSPTFFSACRAQAAASTPRSTIAATSATRLTAAVSALARRRSTCATSAPTAPWCWSTAFASSTPRARAAFRATVDLNTIPANMIDRIEVLQAGASPLYGSDAIAGVVNIITVAQQEGLRASAQYGTVPPRRRRNLRLQASYGIRNRRHDIVFGGSYVKQKLSDPRDRSISQFPNPGQTSCTDPVGGCSSAAVNGRFLGDFGTSRSHDRGRTAIRRSPSSGPLHVG